MSILGFGLWASSGPFPFSAHYGLYKRGRDPPTNPSRHLKKERVILHLKWLLKEGQGGEPTAATAAATAAAPTRADAVPAAEAAAFPCLAHWLPTDVSFSCIVKTQRRWSNKIYKTELTKTRYNNQVLGKYRVDPQRAGLTLIVELT